MTKIIYISGPYTIGDVDSNVLTANQLGIRLMEQGHAVYIPHLSHYLNLQFPHDYEFWMDQDLMILPHCSYLIRIPGESKGADKEVELANKLGISVIQLADLPDPFLLPCPICGDIDNIIVFEYHNVPHVLCDRCNFADNVVNWNRRA
jgi:hypothetical protein